MEKNINKKSLQKSEMKNSHNKIMIYSNEKTLTTPTFRNLFEEHILELLISN